MKVTVVPAQITTIEDRIIGSLGLSQLLLLAAPVFGGSALFMVLPPFFKSAVYKLCIIALLLFFCSLMAVRIKNKILLYWLLMILRYTIRPKYYLYNKNSLHDRNMYIRTITTKLDNKSVHPIRKVQKAATLSPAEIVKLQNLIDNPASNLKFEFTKKGRLYVRLTEICQES